MGMSLKYHAPNKNKTDRFLANAKSQKYFNILDRYGKKGVSALSSATPIDQGNTAGSWTYEVSITNSSARITWSNSNLTSQGVPVAILLQYGHGTGTGGYVSGRDYINPAIKPIFDDMADAVWKEVINV